MTRPLTALITLLLACAGHAADPRAPFESDVFTPGATVELPTDAHPLIEHDILLDDEEFSDRLYSGDPLRIPSVTRTLGDERILVRLPADSDDERPLRGVLLWVHAAPQAVVPQVCVEAADELNLVIVAPANVGNDRLLADRMQVCLDAVATVTEYVPIDESRVYVTGLSGGGRVSSMLHLCFPDVFSGSVPIVGVNCYARLRAGNGRYWDAAMSKPRGERWRLLREQRLAPISGPPDFNHEQTDAAVTRFVRDGLDARYFEYPDQAHTLPTSERFAEALRWVDETWSTRREARLEDAEKLVASVEDSMQRLERNEPTAGQRRRLEKAIETAPWSEPADRARELLDDG